MEDTQKVQVVQLVKSSENEIDLTLEEAFKLPQGNFTNEIFKKNTGLYVGWLEGLSSEEKWQVYVFLTKIKSGKKFAENASRNYRERITNNQRLGIKLREAERNFRNQIAQVKEDFDRKMADFSIEANRTLKDVNNILNKDITNITKTDVQKVKSDVQKLINLIGMNLWS